MTTLAQIGLGSNLGDRKAQLDAAVAALAEAPGVAVRAVSSYHETAPVGGPEGQGAFLNAAASVETTLDALDLLHRLQALEARAGRVRTVRWGERPLDLDLLLFGDRVIETGRVFNRVFGGSASELVVPHPRFAVRRFVLAPLAEIAPGAIDPLTGRTISALLANLDRRPSYVAIHDPNSLFAEELSRRLVKALSAAEIRQGKSDPVEWAYSWNVQRRPEHAQRLYLERFEQQCRELERDRWTAERCGDRWLVTDFWFDAHFQARYVVEADRPQFRRRLFEAKRRVLAPTFVVAPSGYRFTHRRASLEWQRDPHLGDVPILEVATKPRVPGVPRQGPVRWYDFPTHREPGSRIQAMTADVLAACAATRAGR